MGLTIPDFTAIDGTRFYIDDLERMDSVLSAIQSAVGRIFKSGVLYGFSLSSDDGITISVSPGAALTDTGDILIVDPGDITLPVSTFKTYGVSGNLRDVWLYRLKEESQVTKYNVAGGAVSVADKQVLAIGFSEPGVLPDYSFPRVRIGRTTNFNTNPSAFTWNSTGHYIDYYYSLSQLNHLDQVKNKQYTGAKLLVDSLDNLAVSTNAITDGAVTNVKISTINGSSLTKIDATTKFSDYSISGEVLADYSTGISKLSRDIPRLLSWPHVYAIPGRVSGEVSSSVFDANGSNSMEFKSVGDFSSFIQENTGTAYTDFITFNGNSTAPPDNPLFSTSPIIPSSDPFGYGFWVIEWHGRYNSGFPDDSRFYYPTVMKLSNHVPASVGYPDEIEIAGRFPYPAVQSSNDLSGNLANWTYYPSITHGGGITYYYGVPEQNVDGFSDTSLFTPYIIPPDGYVIDSFQVCLGTNDNFYTSMRYSGSEVYMHFPYIWAVAEYQFLCSADVEGFQSNLDRLSARTLIGTKTRGIVGYSDKKIYTDITNYASRIAPHIKMRLKFVDPIDVGVDLKGYDAYLGSSNPYTLQSSICSGCLPAYLGSVRSWGFIDRSAITL